MANFEKWLMDKLGSVEEKTAEKSKEKEEKKEDKKVVSKQDCKKEAQLTLKEKLLILKNKGV